jgi:hypothetical protein
MSARNRAVDARAGWVDHAAEGGMQANILEHMRRGDNRALEVCQWIRYGEGDRSAASTVKDR